MFNRFDWFIEVLLLVVCTLEIGLEVGLVSCEGLPCKRLIWLPVSIKRLSQYSDLCKSLADYTFFIKLLIKSFFLPFGFREAKNRVVFVDH